MSMCVSDTAQGVGVRGGGEGGGANEIIEH